MATSSNFALPSSSIVERTYERLSALSFFSSLGSITIRSLGIAPLSKNLSL
jgi:hypothetical protein